MSEYAVAPEVDAPWHFTAEDLSARITQRWPSARIRVGDVAPDMTMSATIPFDPPRRNLGVVLVEPGDSIVLEPADPDTAVEFLLWYVAQLPAFDPPVLVFNHGYSDSLALRADITGGEILDLLDPDHGATG